MPRIHHSADPDICLIWSHWTKYRKTKSIEMLLGKSPMMLAVDILFARTLILAPSCLIRLELLETLTLPHIWSTTPSVWHHHHYHCHYHSHDHYDRHIHHTPDICLKHHKRCLWRKICHVVNFFHMTDCHVQKFLHMRNVKKIFLIEKVLHMINVEQICYV